VVQAYPTPHFDGAPVAFAPGRYDDLSIFRIAGQLGALELPPEFEVVLFADPHCQGAACLVRGDLAVVAEQWRASRSMLVLDLRRRQQNHVVLFDRENFTGQARVIPATTTPVALNNFTARSVVAPPGLAVRFYNDTTAEPRSVKGNASTIQSLFLGQLKLDLDCQANIKCRVSSFNRLSIQLEINLNKPTKGDYPLVRLQSESIEDLVGPLVVYINNDLLKINHDSTDHKICTLPVGQICRVGIHATKTSFVFTLNEDPPLTWQNAFNFPAVEVKPQLLPETFNTYKGTITGQLISAQIGCRAENQAPGPQAFPLKEVALIYDGKQLTPPGVYAPPGLYANAGTITSVSVVPDTPGIDAVSRDGENWAGIITDASRAGLSLQILPGELASQSLIPFFGGKSMRDDRWHHLALCSAQQQATWYLDGRAVATSPAPTLAGELFLGDRFRGEITQVRIWDRPLSAEQVKQGRFAGSKPEESGGAPIYTFCCESSGQDFGPQLPADLHLLQNVTLPTDPRLSPLASRLSHEGSLKQSATVQTAREKAADQVRRAHERAANMVAAGHQRQLVHTHLAALSRIAFVRGSDVVSATLDKEIDLFVGKTLNIPVSHLGDGSIASLTPMDTALGSNGQLYVAVSTPPGIWEISHWNRINLDAIPLAVAADPVSDRLFWLDVDGNLWTGFIGSDASKTKLASKLPPGRPREWDLTVLPGGGELAWSNGWEIWQARRESNGNTERIKDAYIRVSHALSPHPVAVTLHEDGTLAWVDLEDEVVRVLTPKATLPLDLYPAPKPGRGIGVGIVPGAGSTQTPMLYWVARQRQELEVPVLDDSGLFLWLEDRAWQKDKPQYHAPFNQHVPAVHVQPIGARWERPGQLLDLNSQANINCRVSRVEDLSIQLDLKIKAEAIMPYTGCSSPYLLKIQCKEEYIFVFLEFRRDGAGDLQVALDLKFSYFPEGISEYKLGSIGEKFRVAIKLHNGQLDYYINDRLVDSTHLSYIFNDRSAPTDIFLLPKFEVSHAATGQLLNVQIGRGAAGQTPGRAFALTEIALTYDGNKLTNQKGEVPARREWFSPVLVPQDTPGIVTQPGQLYLENEQDCLELDALRLDLSNGLTIACRASQISKNKEIPSVLLCLASTEHQHRLIFGMRETPGGASMPFLEIRSHGRQLEMHDISWRGGFEAELGLGVEFHLAVTLTPSGQVTFYLNGQRMMNMRFDWKPGVRLWTANRIGNVPPARAEEVKSGIMLNQAEPLPPLGVFHGFIRQLQAWNTALSPAQVKTLVDDPDAQPKPGPCDWDRTLVVDQTEHRFLHAGSLNGQSPAYALMPIELDGGLALVTNLSSQHTELLQAQAALAAAKRYAAEQQAAALEAGKNQVALAQQQVDEERTRARAMLEMQNADAAQNREQQRARLQAVRDQANLTVERARQSAAQQVERAKAEAEQKKNTAQAEKNKQIEAKNKELNEKKHTRDTKQAELAK
jgi:hypothetical protein